MTDAATRPEHSPLGASSAERWMNCPGSNLILRELELPETDEPDYRREGTAMHEAAAWALNNDAEAWELAGMTFNETVMDVEMTDAIGVYLDFCRPLIGKDYGVEYGVSSPVHPLFYGTADFWSVAILRSLVNALYVVDLKGGKGIVVEVEDNPQLKYYAFGLIETLRRERGMLLKPDMPVVLCIVQPRAFSEDGHVREWETTVGEIEEWVHDTLVPAMARAEMDATLEAGPWCRFCPAKLACPLLTGIFKAAAMADPKSIVTQSDEMFGMSAKYVAAVKHYLKAFQDEGLRRAMQGHDIPGTKLVKQKANRVFNEEGQKLAVERFGEDAMTKPELKSPEQIDALGAKGKEFTSEYAYAPDTGLKWVLDTDNGIAVKVKPLAESQAAFVASVLAEEDA